MIHMLKEQKALKQHQQLDESKFCVWELFIQIYFNGVTPGAAIWHMAWHQCPSASAT
jgi:hypothetical protein